MRVQLPLPRLLHGWLAFLVKTALLQGDAGGFDPLASYYGRMAELADAPVSKTGVFVTCGFNSRSSHRLCYDAGMWRNLADALD